MKILAYLFLTMTLVFARYEAKPTKACEAFNNMKHTKNTHHVILDTSKRYTILKSHKGQKLILIKDTTPAQRWVDESCFMQDTTETLARMQEELDRLEEEMKIALGKQETKEKSPLSKTTRANHTLSQMEAELARLEQDKEQTLKPNKRAVPLSKQNILALSWHNAFCETHRYKKECKRGISSLLRSKKEEGFVLHGLWPQPRNRVYCNVSQKDKSLDKAKRWSQLPSIGLSDEIKEKLSEVMPGVASGLHKHEWIKHGSCYGTDANSYYKSAISLLEQFNQSTLAAFFKVNSGKRVTLTQIKKIAQKSFGRGAAKSIAIKCKRGLITELWLQLGSGSDDLATLLKRGKKLYSRCKGGRIDEPGFGR